MAAKKGGTKRKEDMSYRGIPKEMREQVRRHVEMFSPRRVYEGLRDIEKRETATAGEQARTKKAREDLYESLLRNGTLLRRRDQLSLQLLELDSIAEMLEDRLINESNDGPSQSAIAVIRKQCRAMQEMLDEMLEREEEETEAAHG
jgi:hypothetical protein